MADAVTEETLAKVAFDQQPEAMPPIGELAEVTVDLPALAAATVIPNAAVRREGDRLGVWQIVDGDPHFTAVVLGAARSEEHTSELQSLMRSSYAVFCLKKKK